MCRGTTAFVILSVVLTGAACKKPAYSDIKLDERGMTVRNNNEAPKAKSLDPESDLKQTGAMPSGDAGAQKTGVEMPSFYDQKNGRVKDLPRYPRSRAINMQFGPAGGINMLMQVFTTSDKFEDVTAFFDQALKNGGWTIASHDRGEDLYAWELIKSAGDQGAIQVERQKENGAVFIVLRRTEPIPEVVKK